MKNQELLLKHIRTKISNKQSLLEEIAQTLSISYDSAHRRVSGKTKFTIEETIALCNHYSISMDKLFLNGNNYILINERYQGAPKEALASLIAHESVHVLPVATMQEEIQATTTEARTWLMLRANVSSSTNELVLRENNLASRYLASSTGNNEIQKSIFNNPFYKEQLAMK